MSFFSLLGPNYRSVSYTGINTGNTVARWNSRPRKISESTHITWMWDRLNLDEGAVDCDIIAHKDGPIPRSEEIGKVSRLHQEYLSYDFMDFEGF